MTALELYQYIQDNEICYSWKYNEDRECSDVLVWVSIYNIESFVKLISTFDEEIEFQMTLIQEDFVLFMGQICDYYEIDMKQVFKQAS